jgi:hypothetical protein
MEATNQAGWSKGKRFMKINKIRAAGIGCLAAMTGLVTAASMVLTAPADAAREHSHANEAAVEAPGPHSGSCVADSTSVCSGSGQATNNSVSSGDAIADNGSVASGCSVALDHSTASGGEPCPPHAPKAEKAFTPAGPARAVAGNPSFAG